ncbi:MAG: transcription elongation factor GreA [Oligoflexia bacterium]|nr:transcription elongation factor GreA [Oligoflexia bacterium]MBF0367612.1 transcription elongation factor GreA [Oligoflexia bacterium]
MDSIPMTRVGKKQLEDELTHLIRVEREGIKKALAEARALGDLRENAEYHSAKEKQSLIEGRIQELQYKISRAEVVDVTALKGTQVRFGATVTLYDCQKEKSITYQIVGADEADIKLNKIAFNGPLGKNLIGKDEGDTVQVDAPKGKLEYEIQKVEYISWPA